MDEQAIRSACLKWAIETMGVGYQDEDYIRAARMFEAYVMLGDVPQLEPRKYGDDCGIATVGTQVA